MWYVNWLFFAISRSLTESSVEFHTNPYSLPPTWSVLETGLPVGCQGTGSQGTNLQVNFYNGGLLLIPKVREKSLSSGV